MANRRRGDASLTLAGRPHTLRLTLGALAELEDAFEVADLAALGERFSAGRLSSRDLIKILGAALRGGGHEIGDREVAALALDDGLEAVAEAVMTALEGAFGAAPANPPPAQVR